MALAKPSNDSWDVRSLPTQQMVPGGITLEAEGGEERNGPPYLTMPVAWDKSPL